MPSPAGRNPPIPSSVSIGLAGLSSNGASIPTPDNTLRRPSQTHDATRMAPLNGSMPANPNRRGHHRSISHPFTSPFTAIGKKREKAAQKHTAWDSDSDSDEVTYPLQPLSTSPRKESKGGVGNELAEGKCQTCNSTVRWPRNLKVFRCTSCLMVTDLEAEPLKEVKSPIDHDLEGRARGARTAPTEQASPVPSSHEPKPGISQTSVRHTQGRDFADLQDILSAAHVNRLIDSCLSSYFDSLLGGNTSRLAPEDNNTARGRFPRVEGSSRLPGSQPSPGYLSVPGDPRGRSASASSERDQLNGTKVNPALLAPRGNRWADKPLPPRPRANSDQESSSKLGTELSECERPAELETKTNDHRSYIFKRLENHIIAALKGTDLLNASFSTYQPSLRSASSGNPPKMKLDSSTMPESGLDAPVFEPDAKTLLLGDLAENSSWWMTEWAKAEGHTSSPAQADLPHKPRLVSSRNPRINWAEVTQWYQLVLTAGSSWTAKWAARKPDPGHSEADLVRSKRWEAIDIEMIEKDIIESRLHLQRTLTKAVENLLKRPRQVLKKPEDTRFLLILLANPLLSSPSSYSPTPQVSSHRGERRPTHPKDKTRPTTRDGKPLPMDPDPGASVARHSSSNHHYGILKRILGLMSNLPNECHHYLVSWFSRLSPGQFERLVDLVGGFVNYRLTRQHGRKRSQPTKDGDDLIPSFASAAGNTPAELHAAINRRSPQKQPPKKREAPIVYEEDWQIRAASRIMSLLFTANNTHASRKQDGLPSEPRGLRHADSAVTTSARRQGYMVPISAFYNTLLDYSDLIADFETWESRSTKFSFCQYPFFLSIWAKIHILEHDARRQMEVKAREAFFNSILNSRPVSQYLVLKVRRDCLVEDSLRGVSEVVGTGQEEIKKGLRIEFVGEEGVDAGGLRKEWFLLLVREVFDPHHGLFIYDDDSQYCYFNPYCFESSEQFFLVGVLLGLAIYNSTILDIDLPPFAFKKLLAAAPQTGPPGANSLRSRFKCTLEDLAEYRPALAKGLRILLEYEGDVAETFCYDFVAQVDRYGEVVDVPLCAGGEKRPVTNSNRREFVDLYVHYLLDTAVSRQFEPFKRGFFTVCGGNALSLFRAEEIELLVRGSDEALDVLSLRAVASYDNWSTPRPESVPVVQWFWEFFETSSPQAQRQILSFVTGSDRIPAMGATSLSIRLACLGDDCSRYPIARTCFNTLGLYRYASKQKFRQLLWDAVTNSQGFGFK